MSGDTRSVSAPRRRVLAYDALRGLAIVAVVGIHTLMPLRDLLPNAAFGRVLDDLLHFAVPLFVFISGALVWAKPWPRSPGAYRTFLVRRTGAVLLPFMAWAGLYGVLYLARAADPSAALRALPGLLVSGHVWYHLYFVPMLLGFYVMTPLASRLAHRSPELLVVLAYVVRIALWPTLGAVLKESGPDLVWSVMQHITQHLPHMALGAWFAIRYDATARRMRILWPVSLAAGTAILLWAALDLHRALPGTPRLFVYPVGMALTVLGLAYGAFALEPLYDRYERQVVGGGVLAFGVYFIHPALLAALVALVPARGWLSPFVTLGAWAAVTAGSYAASWALARSPRTSWLAGVRPSASG
ncbi:MAG: acyltransferase [Actinobacteria bacterium]|nr:MAG: acyltransferase [Actinomycetota bacterium]